MLVFPQWKPDLPGGGCRGQRWMNAERFAPYLARSIVLPPLPPQFEDEESLGGSSPEYVTDVGVENKDGVCGWRGCGARFQNVARLSAHVARVHAHAHRDGLFYCGWRSCSRPLRGFNARYKMLVHVRTHTNERPHICNQCNKSFSRAENLKIHLRSHSGEKPYICPYEGCGKAYSNSSDRFKHTRTHTIDKPYFCKVPGCNKRYTDPSSLRKHVKTYKHFTSEKENPCRHADDNKYAERLSPQREVTTYTELASPLRDRLYSPPKSVPSPQISPYDPIGSLETPVSPPYNFVPVVDQHSYIPLEPVYPLRIPTNEITYMEYSHMYDHAYKSFYLNNINYPVLKPSSMREKLYAFDDRTQFNDVKMDNVLNNAKVITEDVPLNLMCSKRYECKPMEELVNIADLPLDLTTKS